MVQEDRDWRMYQIELFLSSALLAQPGQQLTSLQVAHDPGSIHSVHRQPPEFFQIGRVGSNRGFMCDTTRLLIPRFLELCGIDTLCPII